MLFLAGIVGACTTAPKKASREEVAKVNLQLGVGYLQQGELDVALEKLNKALEADPDSAKVHGVIALTYEQTGNVKLADRHYRMAVKLTPKETAQAGDAHNNYGAFLCRRNALARAAEEFQKAIDNPLYRTPDAAYENAALCALRIPDVEKAERSFRRALQANPRLSTSLFHMANIELDKGNFLQARAFIQRFHEVSPVTPKSLYLGIRIARRLDDQQAVSRYARLLQTTFPESDEAGLLSAPDKAQEVK